MTLIGLGLMAVIGCHQVQPMPPLLSQKSPGIDLDVFQSYGAVYEYDEYRIRAEFSPYNGSTTYYRINRKLHILNQRGVKYATLDFSRQAGRLLECDITVMDRSGQKKQIDAGQIKEKFNSSKKIIIPQVTAGCSITLGLLFVDREPFFNSEYAFIKPVPVIRGRFSLFWHPNYQYDFKTYGKLAAKTLRVPSFSGFVVDGSQVFPEKDFFVPEGDIGLGSWKGRHTPRVLLRLSKISYDQKTLFKTTGWNGISKQYRELLLSPSLFSSRSRIDRLARETAAPEKSDFDRADAILSHVQENFSVSRMTGISSFSIDTDKVLAQKRGNPLEIAVVLKQMLLAAGFPTRICATRPAFEGGFDETFPTWLQVGYPFIIVSINGTDFVAYPYISKLRLGEYPFFIETEKALDIENARIISPPPSPCQDGSYTAHAKLDLSFPDQNHNWTFKFGDQLAVLLRKDMDQHSRLGIKERFKSVLKSYDDQLSLSSASLSYVQRGRPVTVNAAFKRDGLVTARGDQAHLSLKPFFKKYFTDHEKYRHTAYINPLELVIKEKVTVHKKPSDRIFVQFPDEDIYNSLFSAQYTCRITDDTICVIREITLKKTRLAPGKLELFKPDIERLNRISESHLITKAAP